MRMVNICMSPELNAELKEQAWVERTSVSALVRGLIIAYLNEKKEESING